MAGKKFSRGTSLRFGPLKLRNLIICLALHMDGFSGLIDWLHQAQTARQNCTRQSHMKKLLVLSGFLDQKFAGNLREVGQVVPNSARISLCLQKET